MNMLGGLLRAYALASAGSQEQARAIDKKVAAMRAARLRAAKTGAQHARELEDDLGRVALLARALAEVCLQKGLMTREELGRMIEQVDMADGSLDGKLDPKVTLPGESKLAELEPLDPGRAEASKTIRRKKPRH
jgi:hypothetical protein